MGEGAEGVKPRVAVPARGAVIAGPCGGGAKPFGCFPARAAPCRCVLRAGGACPGAQPPRAGGEQLGLGRPPVSGCPWVPPAAFSFANGPRGVTAAPAVSHA